MPKIKFALMDCKDYEVVNLPSGYPNTEKNFRLLYEMKVNYLKKVRKAQEEISEEYFPQLESLGESLSWEDINEIDIELYENFPDELNSLYYT